VCCIGVIQGFENFSIMISSRTNFSFRRLFEEISGIESMKRNFKNKNIFTRYFSRLFGQSESDADVVLVSFPKSGRTWLRLMLDAVGLEIDYTHDLSGHHGQRHHAELKHDKSAYRNRKVILLVRDPRDVVVSGYFQATKRIGVYDGSISDFIRDPKHGIEKIVIFNSMWLSSADVPRSFCLVKYEDMHTRLREVLAEVIHFADPARPLPDLNPIIELGRFENMKEMESKGVLKEKYGNALKPGDPGDSESFKCRKGVVGGFREYMNEDDIQFCHEVMEKYQYFDHLNEASRIHGVMEIAP
jgi:hypothetical protein